MTRTFTNPPPIINDYYENGGKKAYIKPSMELYPLCDKILGPEGGVSGAVIGWDAEEL